MMLISTVLVALLTTTGLALSYAPDLPAGATIVVLAGAVYIAVTAGRGLMRWRRQAGIAA
jgi:zinc transport system permease protein